MSETTRARILGWLPRWKWLAVLALVLFQAWALYFRLTLSLGPRVIFAPWVLQRGYVLYENIGDQHSPLMTLILTMLVPLVPDGLRLAKLVLVILIALSALLTFWAARRAVGWWGGMGAALFFVIWAPAFGYGKLWHETFLTPLYLLLLILYDPGSPPRSARRLLLLGMIGGIAIGVKQHAVVVVAALVAWNSFANWRAHRAVREIVRDAALVLAPAALPMLGFIAYHYARVGTLDNFFYWTFFFNFFSEFRNLAALAPTWNQILLIMPAGFFLPAAILHGVDLLRRRDTRVWHLGWGLTLLVTAGLTAYPRFGFFHLQAVLPILAWLSALAVVRGFNRNAARFKLEANYFLIGSVVAVALYWFVTAGSIYQVVFQSNQSRYIYEYTDLVPLAQAVQEKIGPTECVYIFPDAEDLANLYYLTQCEPPKFWIFNYPWFMTDRIKGKILSTLYETPPKWILYFPTHWNIQSSAPELVQIVEDKYEKKILLDWAQQDVWLLGRKK